MEESALHQLCINWPSHTLHVSYKWESRENFHLAVSKNYHAISHYRAISLSAL